MKSLVGYTGFVGSNLASQEKFDVLYNSSNITEAFGTHPDLLVYAGVKAEKYLANKDPGKDHALIEEAIDNIQKIRPQTLVLISTIDVYKNPVRVDEDTVIDIENLQPYGMNRYLLEKWVEESLVQYLIIRLPGLYGRNLKKNFIYDMLNIIPLMLTETKFNEIVHDSSFISAYYSKQDNGFYKCRDLTKKEMIELREYFESSVFNALSFTDSRAIFQFYNLAFLWKHIQTALMNNIKKLNLATEPVSANELYYYIKGYSFVNELLNPVPYYNFKTKHYSLFNGTGGYIFNKTSVLEDIAKFVKIALSE